MRSIRKHGLKLLLGCSALLWMSMANAAGFYISEIGTPGSLGTGGAANTTNNFGADASYTNPAGMTGLKEDQMMAGMQVLAPLVKFDSSQADAGGNDGHNAANAAAIPSFFYVNKLSDKYWAGFSIVAPMGGGLNYGEDFVGRYGATKAVLTGVGVSPSLGVKINDRFSVGAGVSVLFTRFDENIAINLPGPVPDGKVKIERATDVGYQPFLGLTWQLNNRTTFGLVYRAEADVDLNGDLNFRNMPGGFTPPANKVGVSWDNPQLLEVGIRYNIKDDLILVANADWEDWSEFSRNRLEVSGGTLNPNVTLDRNWKDTWHVAMGLVRMRTDKMYSVGISYDSSVVDDEDRTIDLPLDQQLKLSAAYAWKGSKKLDYALGATLAWFGDGETDQTAQGVQFKGKFHENYVLFLGGSLRYLF